MAPPTASESNAMGDFFSQLVGLEAAVEPTPESSAATSQVTKAVPDRQAEALLQIFQDLPDLSFMLSDRLVLKEQNLTVATSAATSSATSASEPAFTNESAAMETSASFSSPFANSASSFPTHTEESTSASATYSADPDPSFATKQSLTPTPTHEPLQETTPCPSSTLTPFESTQVGLVETLLVTESGADRISLECNAEPLDHLQQANINALEGLDVPVALDFAEIIVEEDNEWGDFTS